MGFFVAYHRHPQGFAFHPGSALPRQWQPMISRFQPMIECRFRATQLRNPLFSSSFGGVLCRFESYLSSYLKEYGTDVPTG